jgi:lipopolysaccharide/colanic/teichoic acid biosynthesis glycosyltransferase
MLSVAIAVVIDDGFPVLFGHTRQKKDGVNFKCWKFRTMRRNAEAMVAELQAMNKADGPQVFIENDPRVTRVGRILRKLQLDELPQFWNVLVGDMSVVGPRPSPDKENQFNPAWREMRLSVRPGITGLWQVERTRTPGQDFQEWIKYDIEYVRSASFRLDLKIIAKTVRNILKRG